MSKKICLLGATGSIGRQTIDVVSQHDDIEIYSMCCNTNTELFEKQIRKVKPKVVCVYDDIKYFDLKGRLADTDIKILSGMEGINRIVSDINIDMVISGISGMIGLEPTLTAIEAGKDIALANKETLVTAGNIVMSAAKEKNVDIIPVDSEHSAIYQCIDSRAKDEIEKVIITASGGPFRGYGIDELKDVTKEQALKHPNWDMGAKITIDSSTMVNKGLEIIEAVHLFDLPLEKIEVLVHPESIIHSMVQFRDGAVMAQLGTSSMKVPIQYALYKGIRRDLDVERVDFLKLGKLTFEKPDLEVFKGLRLAIDALKVGGTMPAVYNTVNEIMVDKFLKNEIRYLEIVHFIEETMEEHKVKMNPELNDIYEAIEWVKEKFK